MLMHEKLINLFGLKASDAELASKLSQIGLTEPEIKQFDEDSYYEFRPEGVSVVFEDGILSAVLLYAAGAEAGFSEYRQGLPEDLRFSWSKAEVLRNLGAPEKAGAGSKTRSLTVPSWVRYSREGHYLHLQFSAAEDRIISVSFFLQAKLG